MRVVLVCLAVLVGVVAGQVIGDPSTDGHAINLVDSDETVPSLFEATADSEVDAGADAEFEMEAGAEAETEAAAEVDAEASLSVESEKSKNKQSKKLNLFGKKKKGKRVYVGGDVKFNRAMSVKGVMAAGSIVANNATIKGTLIARQIKTKHVKSHTMSVGELKTTRLSSPTGTIVINGDLLITSDKPKKNKKGGKKVPARKGGKKPAPITNAAKGVSFLAEEVVIAGVKQWALVRHDTFQDDAEGWTLVHTKEPVPTSSCVASNGDRFLGGHCVMANGPARKSFTDLPPHTQVRMTARYHFIDHWSGQTAFAAVDGSYVWTQSHRLPSEAVAGVNGLQLCGSELYPETRLSSPIDISLPHTGDSVTVSFGAHSSSDAAVRSLQDEKQNACERSFGVDDVAIWVR